MATALLIIGLLSLIGGGVLFIYTLKKFVHDPTLDKLDKPNLIKILSGVLLLSIGVCLLVGALFSYDESWYLKTVYDSGLFEGDSINYVSNISMSLVGSFFFALSFSFLWGAFYLFFYKSKLDKDQKSLIKKVLIWSIPLAFVAFLLFMEGLAPYLSYPLVSGFHFGKEWGWDYTYTSHNDGNVHIAWYGVIILFGVLVSYWVCDHAFYKEFHKHGILDTLVLIAFPAGIIGARIWYVVGNWNLEFANNDFKYVFYIWDGGLTILGGAFAGVLAGYLFIKFRRKYVNPRFAIDVCVPSVLLAQAIGRWGNFFNVEVYGKQVALSDGWSWLPKFISMQMNCVNHQSIGLAAGQINVPLYLVESLLSIAGYFIVVYGVGKGLKKYIVKGDLAGCYFLWYGIVRLIMEPMRNSNFNMGTDNAWSISNSIVYIAIGVGIILFLHLHDYLLGKEKKDFLQPLFAFLLALPACFFPFIRSLTASISGSSSLGSVEIFSGFDIIFNHSSSLLVAYIFILIGTFAALVELGLVLLHKDSYGKYFSYASMAFLFLGGLMFLLGKDWTDLGSTLTVDGTTYKNVVYSLSYGFVLTSLGAFLSLSTGLSSLLARRDAKKAQLEQRADV